MLLYNYLPFWAFTCVYVHATSTTYNLRKLLHKFIFQHICPAISVTTYTQTGSVGGNNQYIFIKLYDIDYEVSMYTFTISYKVSSWNTTWKLDQCTKRKHRQLCKFPRCFINSIFPWPKFIPYVGSWWWHSSPCYISAFGSGWLTAWWHATEHIGHHAWL